jgi:hypothetical protein
VKEDGPIRLGRFSAKLPGTFENRALQVYTAAHVAVELFSVKILLLRVIVPPADPVSMSFMFFARHKS